MIPTEIYIYFLIFVVVLLVLVGLYAFFYQGLESMTKTIIIWYVIILGVNLINIISVFKFYEKNKNRKGIKGVKGDPGPRGFKGVNQQCSSCGDAGMTKEIYGSVINDNGEKVLSKNVKEGKCIFPFSHNYKYNYDINDIFVDDLLLSLKSKNFFKSSIFSKEDQKYLINSVKEINTYKGNLKDSDICFIKKN